MTPDDDVERLFSWLQTPDIRYREFASAREVSGAAPTSPAHAITAQELPHEETAPVAPAEAPRTPAVATHEPVVSPAPAEVETAAPLPAPARPAIAASAPPESAAPHDQGQAAAPSSEAGAEAQPPHTLSSVFNRLSGGRRSEPDTRRIRHIPGWGPTSGRPR